MSGQNKGFIGKMENNNERLKQDYAQINKYMDFHFYKDQCNHHNKKRSWESLRCFYFMNGPRRGLTCGTVFSTHSTKHFAQSQTWNGFLNWILNIRTIWHKPTGINVKPSVAVLRLNLAQLNAGIKWIYSLALEQLV